MTTTISKSAAFPYIGGSDYGTLILQSRSTNEIMELLDETRNLLMSLGQNQLGVGVRISQDGHSIEVHWVDSRKLVTFRQNKIQLSENGSGWMVGVTMKLEHEYQPDVGNDGYMSTTVNQTISYAMVRDSDDDSVKTQFAALSGWLSDPKTTVREMYPQPAAAE